MRDNVSSSKIKLLFLVGELGLGGSERQLYLVLKHLDKRLFDCHVVVFNPSPNLVLNDALCAEEVQVWEIPLACRGIWSRLWFLFKLAKKIQPAIVHSWTAHDNPYAGILGRLVGVRMILGSFRNLPDLPSFQAMPGLYRWLVLHSVPGLIVNTEAIKAALMARGYPASRVEVIPNCVELPRQLDQLPDLEDLGIQSHHRVVGIVGNLRRVKNHEMYVAAMARVIAAYPDARGLIVGQPVASDPGQAERTREAIRDAGLEEHVMMAGFRSDVPELMQRFTVCCLTSSTEGMPNAILEAMAAARPVVATNVGGVAELVTDGETGYLIEEGDIPGFAEAVGRLLANPDQARQMGIRGRERIKEKFSCACAAAKFAKRYQACLEEEITGLSNHDERQDDAQTIREKPSSLEWEKTALN